MRCSEAGFSQVMLKANDLVGHPAGLAGRGAGGARAAACAAPASRCCAISKGLTGHLHQLQGRHRQDDAGDVRGTRLRRAAGLFVDLHPRQHRPGRTSRATCASSRCWRCRTASASRTRGCPGAAPSTNSPPPGTSSAAPTARTSASASTRSTSSRPRRRSTRIDELDPAKIFLVQLSDFMWQETRTFEERMATARTFRVFPGEGRPHRRSWCEMMAQARRAGLRGRLQLRGLQRRLRADAAADGGAARPPLGAVAGRGRAAALGAAAQPASAAPACVIPGLTRDP